MDGDLGLLKDREECGGARGGGKMQQRWHSGRNLRGLNCGFVKLMFKRIKPLNIYPFLDDF